MLGSSFEDGKIYKHNEGSYNDAGVAIPYKVRTRPLDQDKFVNEKKYRKAYAVLKQN